MKGLSFFVILYAMCFYRKTQNAQDFFLNDLVSRTAVVPSSFTEFEKPSKFSTATVDINFAEVITPVSGHVYGNNANIYLTQMVDQPVLLNNIRTLAPNVIRFLFPIPEIDTAQVSTRKIKHPESS